MTASGLPPRAAAWRVLHDSRRGVPFDLALERAFSDLSEPDRRLCHELAAGALRQRAPLDAALRPWVRDGLERVREDVLDVLRLGAYQLLFLERVPAHAAVDTSVTLARRIAGSQVGGFINAVLRRIAERRAGPASGGPAPATASPGGSVAPGTPAALALLHSHPAWLVERWIARFGLTEAEALLRANNTRPPLVVQPARWSGDALAAAFDQAGIEWEPAALATGLAVRGRRAPELPGFPLGAFQVQDPAQAMVARFVDPPAGALLFDACAAPGGKSVALTGAARLVVAGEPRLARARRLASNLRRAASGPAAVIVADGTAAPLRGADAVLVDAPCLGTGAFARHPDARWRVSADALVRLAAQARGLLHALAEMVRPGGLLVFSTCSLESEENEVQIEAFLAADRRFHREPTSAVPGELLSPAGDLVLLPQRHGADGAYAARLRRAS